MLQPATLIWFASLVFAAGGFYFPLRGIPSKVDSQEKRIIALETKVDYIYRGMETLLSDRRKK